MIEINPVASSSLANAYIISDGSTPLLLEAGLRFKELQKATGFKLSTYAGVLISHSHMDHSRAVFDLLSAGIECFMSIETANNLDVTEHHRAIIIQPLRQFPLGSWTVLPFPVDHDCPGTLCFLLASGSDKLLFATDTPYLRYRFTGISHLMIECNYVRDVLTKNVETGEVSLERKNRIVRSHFGLHNLLDMLRANDWSKLQECWLIHLSRENSHEEQMKRAVAEVLGKPVYIAKE